MNFQSVELEFKSKNAKFYDCINKEVLLPKAIRMNSLEVVLNEFVNGEVRRV